MLDCDQPPGQRSDLYLLQFLRASLGDQIGLSRSQLQHYLRAGRLTINGQPYRREPLRAGMILALSFPPASRAELDQVPLPPLDLLYVDEHLLVLNKPPGLTVHPSNSQTAPTLVDLLRPRFVGLNLERLGGPVRPGIVHRLDKNTSGLMMVALSDRAYGTLIDRFGRHLIERHYLALSYASPPQMEGRIDQPIARHPVERTQMAVVAGPSGKRAVTHYRVLARYRHAHSGVGTTGLLRPFASQFRVQLETGRTHQIRVHFTHLGMSLLGDPTYGRAGPTHSKWRHLPLEIRERIEQMPGQALHSASLRFEHPVSGAQLAFIAPPPASFQALLDALSPYAESTTTDAR